MKRSVLVALLLGLVVLAMSSLARTQQIAACGCYCGKVIRPPCSDNACKLACGWRAPSSGGSQPNYDANAAAAAAEAERERQAEADRQRRQQEAEEQRRRDEEAARQRQADFERKKQEALDSMKDLDGSGLGLKGGTDSLGLKDLSDTNSGGLGLRDAPNSSSSQKALDDANSNRVSTRQGLLSTTPEGKTQGTGEDASGLGRNVFDTTGERHSAAINTGAALRNVGNPPSVKALLKHIPAAARDNPAIKNSVAWYSQLETNKTETKTKIIDVQKKIDTHAGDPTVLSTYKTQLGNKLKQIDSDEQTAQSTIKKTLNNLSLPWIENPPADANANAGKGKSQ